MLTIGFRLGCGGGLGGFRWFYCVNDVDDWLYWLPGCDYRVSYCVLGSYGIFTGLARFLHCIKAKGGK